MSVKRRLRRGLLLAGVLFSLSASTRAAKDPFEQPGPTASFDASQVEQWKEVEVPLPAYPRENDLVAVALAPTDTLKLYIDAGSVSRAADSVLRATLVVESRSGARSVFFDGIRCETREYKTYAIGSPERTLVPVKHPRWQEIPRVAYNAFRLHLFRYYSCDGASSSALDREQFLRRLKSGPAQ